MDGQREEEKGEQLEGTVRGRISGAIHGIPLMWFC